MWGELALLAGSALGNYFGNKKTKPTPPPAPTNYYGADGAMQVWSPSTNGYFTLGARTPTDELSSNWLNRLIENKMMGGGGYDQTRSNLDREIQALQEQYNLSGDVRARTEIQRRIGDLTSTRDNMKDVNLGYSAIGVTDPTQMLKYRGATDTVSNYLTDTLDTNYRDTMAAHAQARAKQGMGQSTMADWGRDEMARRYATDKTGIEVQSENYFRQLQAADEAAKMGILGAARQGVGLNASLAQGRNNASQAQNALAQQLGSFNNEMTYNWNMAKDNWKNQSNQNLWSSLAGAGKMAVGGWMGGLPGMMGMDPKYWDTGWGGKNLNPNAGTKKGG